MAETVFDPLLLLHGDFASVVGPNLINLVIYTFAIAAYSIFVWHFHRFVAQRDVFKWDTEKFERSGTLGRFGHGFAYFVKYLVAYPILVFVWFGVFSVFMFLLGKSLPVENVLLITFALVTSIRIVAYYAEEMSNTLAILIPVTLLIVYVSDPSFFDFGAVGDRAFNVLNFVGDILKYTAFSVFMEWVLRISWSIKQRIAPHVHAPQNVVERFGR